MRYEPRVDRAHLAQTIRITYGLPVDKVEFVPVGYAAACYALRCPNETWYFAKLWPRWRAEDPSGSQRETTLSLLRALRDRRLYPRVPCPIVTQSGATWASCDGIPFAVFPFLPGRTPPDWPAWPLHVWVVMARALAAIHRARPALADVPLPREKFSIPFEADLLHGLDQVHHLTPAARPGLRALRDLVQPRRADILAQLARLHRLQQTVQTLPSSFVLCHRDFGGDNLFVDDDGALWVLDWDGACLAPPEHDLCVGAEGGHLAQFLAAYAEAGGVELGQLHLDQFAFALLRRYVQDLAARLLRLLEDVSEDEQQDALDGMVAWGFSQWSRLDDRLDALAGALAE